MPKWLDNPLNPLAPYAKAIRVGLIILAIVVVVGGGTWLVNSLIGGKRAETEAKLKGNQADAAIESGKDAANTVGDQATNEAETGRKVNDAQHQVDAAPDVDAADAAGRNGLHHVAGDHR